MVSPVMRPETRQARNFWWITNAADRCAFGAHFDQDLLIRTVVNIRPRPAQCGNHVSSPVFGSDGADANRIHKNSVGRNLKRKRLGEVVDGGAEHMRDEQLRIWIDSADGGHVDDASPSPHPHGRYGGLAEPAHSRKA